LYPDIENIVAALNRGGVIIYPTDTIWGIGCDVSNTAAIKRVYEIKEREADKPLIVLVSDLEMLKEYVDNIHPRIESLLHYHEKPLTVIYKEVRDIPEILRGKNGSVGIRIVQDDYCRNFIRKFGRPIVSTSVNKSGQPAPVHFAEIEFDLLNDADYVSQHRRNDKFEAIASKIISFNSNGKIKFLR
jgi:L-threonylcarbamoyladenylate synthase